MKVFWIKIFPQNKLTKNTITKQLEKSKGKPKFREKIHLMKELNVIEVKTSVKLNTLNID